MKGVLQHSQSANILAKTNTAACRLQRPYRAFQAAHVSALSSRKEQAEQHTEGATVREGERSADSRRDVLLQTCSLIAVAAVAAPSPASALPGFKKDLKPKRRQKIPESEYKDGPEGLKYYDVVEGTGPIAVQGSRVAVHYDCSYHNVTFMTSRQGMGVTGGTPVGFDVGAKGAGGTLPGLDLGVRGMRVGGQRKLLVPPNLAYGDKGMREIPPGATLEFDLALLSIKSSPFGYRTKIVEG